MGEQDEGGTDDGLDVAARRIAGKSNHPGGSMLKALFVMIVLSNDYAARMVQRLTRHSLA
ncbi:MAG: hypothetical protein IPF77_02760 [Gemmatimonadetes bacterium]|nr:hypothetical protein [Gemmatimonadota bacterium]